MRMLQITERVGLRSVREEMTMVNDTRYCVCITPDDLKPEMKAKLTQRRAAVLKQCKWQPGDQISIRFLGGSPALQARVKKVALTWLEVANLKFQFVDSEPTDIRIAFMQGRGSWSYLGTVCRQISSPEPTMNYGWLTDQSTDDDVERVVLHEFGHAIGLIHEHQNPERAIEWNKPAVVEDLSGPPNHWDEATIENNMFKVYQQCEVQATEVDALSIMMYPIPSSWTVDGFSAGLNSELSESDKSLVRTAYPR